jgi:hypothetical protein
MYVIELNLVNVEENILNFVLLKHYMEHEVYEQTKFIFRIKNSIKERVALRHVFGPKNCDLRHTYLESALNSEWNTNPKSLRILKKI